MISDPNPFAEKEIAEEWMVFIENNEEALYLNEIFPAIKQWGAKQEGKLLDVGCGQGNIVQQMTPDGAIQYYGVEPSSYLLSRALELYSKCEWCTFHQGSFAALPYTDHFFGAGMSINVLSHVSDLGTSIAEMFRVLKSGSSVLLISLNPEQNLFWNNHYRSTIKIDGGIMGTVITEKSSLHRNTFYPHTSNDWKMALKDNKLKVVERKTYGRIDASTEGIFVAIECVVQS
jgi:ubiquinone/menaquinone biosynthesis C-methylase UbiE